jgi:hypothetical protein
MPELLGWLGVAEYRIRQDLVALKRGWDPILKLYPESTRANRDNIGKINGKVPGPASTLNAMKVLFPLLLQVQLPIKSGDTDS